MTLWAIVPVKPLRRGKSRLAGALSEDERTELNQTLLQHTLKHFPDSRNWKMCWSSAGTHAALTIARNYGARTVREDGQPRIEYRAQARNGGRPGLCDTGVLILPADLPLITR